MDSGNKFVTVWNRLELKSWALLPPEHLREKSGLQPMHLSPRRRQLLAQSQQGRISTLLHWSVAHSLLAAGCLRSALVLAVILATAIRETAWKQILFLSVIPTKNKYCNSGARLGSPVRGRWCVSLCSSVILWTFSEIASSHYPTSFVMPVQSRRQMLKPVLKTKSTTSLARCSPNKHGLGKGISLLLSQSNTHFHAVRGK